MFMKKAMGRGRKGFLNQSVKKFNPRKNENIAKIFRSPGERDEKKINLQEQAVEFMVNMSQQELVDFLLSNDWHVKTSGINASGC